MSQRAWNDDYAAGDLPWDTGEPELLLVELITAGVIKPGRALEIGCGTGTNACWLASSGFDVLGVDLAPLAIEQARRKAVSTANCRFEVADFLAPVPLSGPFEFVFDRGCFHIFDDAEARARFAERVSACLATGGQWLSLIGSTEGPPRDLGPPRRTARDIMNAIEPSLEIELLRSSAFQTTFEEQREAPPKAWVCLSRKRMAPAQPSTHRE